MSSAEIHYELAGPPDAPVLMLAGPLGSTLELWESQVTALTEHFRLLRYDHRAHGRSPVPAGPYAMTDLGGDALALLDRLGLERVTFCGISLGGMVGIWLGGHAPQRLSSLVLCSTSAHYDDPGPWHERAATVRSNGTSSLAPTVVSRWFTPDWAAQHPEMVDLAVGMISQTSDEGYAACCEAIASWDGRELLGQISVPTLVIAGSDDPSTPITPHAQTIVAGIPGAKLEVLDAAHLVLLEPAEQARNLLIKHATGR